MTYPPAKTVVEITELSTIPQEYITITVEETPDKRAIAAALKTGEDVPGARLVTDKKSVVTLSPPRSQSLREQRSAQVTWRAHECAENAHN